MGVRDYEKVYIEMNETVTKDGRVLPRKFKWIEGNDEYTYEIGKILEIKKTAAPHVGGLATRYKVRINGQDKCLWYEGPRWFVERFK